MSTDMPKIAPPGTQIVFFDEHAATQQALIEHCRAQLIKWSCPREIEFRRELPRTRVGKIDYKVLVAEHVAREETATKGQA